MITFINHLYFIAEGPYDSRIPPGPLASPLQNHLYFRLNPKDTKRCRPSPHLSTHLAGLTAPCIGPREQKVDFWDFGDCHV